MIWLLLIIIALLIIIIKVSVNRPAVKQQGSTIQQFSQTTFDPWDAVLREEANEEMKDRIRKFLQPDRIDPLKFMANVQVYKMEEIIAQKVFGINRDIKEQTSRDIEKAKIIRAITPSMPEFIDRGNAPRFVYTEMWFIAAYPDVLKWVNEKGQYLIGADGEEKFQAFENGVISIHDVLRWLVDWFKSHNTQKLECQL